MTGEGAFASAVQIPLQPFTLVGATTRTGLLTAPLFSRFGHVVRLDFYPAEDLAQHRRAERAAPRVDVCPSGGARDCAPLAGNAARGQPAAPPRARLRRGARDRAHRSAAMSWTACTRLEIDEAGLDEMDRRLLAVHHRPLRRRARGGRRRSRPRSASRATRSRTWSSRSSSSRASWADAEGTDRDEEGVRASADRGAEGGAAGGARAAVLGVLHRVPRARDARCVLRFLSDERRISARSTARAPPLHPRRIRADDPARHLPRRRAPRAHRRES